MFKAPLSLYGDDILPLTASAPDTRWECTWAPTLSKGREIKLNFVKVDADRKISASEYLNYATLWLDSGTAHRDS